MRKKSLDNMGFSLVELIVAILIIAIISSGAIVAFGSSWGMKAEAAARNVTDAMKQARSAALGRKNKQQDDKTDVYAKFYSDDGTIYVDICTKESGSESVLHNQTIGSDYYQIKFYDSTDTEYATVGDDVVYVYFLKSTGGVASVQKGTELPVKNIQKMKVGDSAGGEYEDIILVNLTGRCYIDRSSAESGGSGSESGSGG